MCGIFCAVSLAEPFNGKDYVAFIESTDIVTHRGPDSSGAKTFKLSQNFSNNEFNIFFGHRRLAVIDLSKEANQPMESNGKCLIYNGEIFNYLELKRELISLGCDFQTNSDTEVIIKIYEKYGSLGFSKLNGMWAFIIYDSINNLIIASRDRFSNKPLFYYKKNERFYFASEIKQLTKFLTSAKLNETIMSSYLRQGLLDFNNETFYQDIFRLESKTNLIINLNSNSIVKEKYWDYKVSEFNDNEIENKFLDLFYDSVKIRLRSDAKVGLLLSGGLDSSAIAVALKELGDQDIQSYTVISENKKYNEEKFSDLISKEIGIRNYKLLINSNDVLNDIDQVFYYQDEPFNSFSVVAQYSIFRKIKSESDLVVVLSGQGGDELLLGYLKYYFYHLKKLSQEKEYLELFNQIFLSLIQRTMIMRFRISLAKRYIPGYSKKKNFLIKPYLNEEKIWEVNSIKESQIKDIDKYSIPILTRYEDRNSMAHSLETRLPFLDHRLVEFFLDLDIKFKFRKGWNKYILRNSFDQMPHKIKWRRDKKGFTIPEEMWLKNEFKSDIRECFKTSILSKTGYIEDKKFLDYYDYFLSGKKNISFFEIARIYIAEKWLRTHPELQ